VEDKIKKVETGLINPIYIEGDSTWTIEQRMKHYHVPGVSIAVINDGKIEWAKSYGVMDEETKEPVTNQTLFQAGSISKPVAAYGSLKMVEEGKINLDENVNTYLKTWKLPDNEFTKEKKVALKHLLSHTGGVTVHGFLGYSPDLPVPTLVQVLDGTPPANSPPIRVDKAPETGYRYSGGGYTIMQQMVMDIEGKSFPEIAKGKVLQPLSMNNSTYDQPLQGEQLKMAATGYLPNGTMTKGKRHTYPEMAAAGLWTTAEDLAKFAVNIQATLKGESNKVLSKAMTEKMLTPFGSEFDGLGLFINQRKGDIYFGHGGWDEGFSSQMTVSKDKGYGVVVLTNSNHPDFIEELIRSVARTYNWSNYVDSYKKVDMDTSKFATIRGRYRNGSDGMITVSTKGNTLFRKYLRGTPTELFQISDSTYIGRENDQVIQFKKNPADGQLNILLIYDDKQEFLHPKLKEGEKVPYEYLLTGDFNNAVKGYEALMKTNPKDDAINEQNLNSQGYDLLNEDKTKLALDVFKINIALYPKSANVYDSYGEACAKNGDLDLAITNYQKALAIEPKKESAVKMLAELQKKKSGK
jgi:CubicO group peptidase (beta-lactamase class C family)